MNAISHLKNVINESGDTAYLREEMFDAVNILIEAAETLYLIFPKERKTDCDITNTIKASEVIKKLKEIEVLR